MHQFKTEQFLPITKATAWDFFISPKNLSLITPPEMDFKILSKIDEKGIYEGMLINYTVKPLWGIKVFWQTEICKVDFEKYFTDRQTKGPYKIWEHTHKFLEVENGIIMTDIVNYKLSLGIIGILVEKFIVRKKIINIFAFRTQILNKIFN